MLEIEYESSATTCGANDESCKLVVNPELSGLLQQHAAWRRMSPHG